MKELLAEDGKFQEAVEALEHFMQLNWTGPATERLPVISDVVIDRKYEIFTKCRRVDLLFFARRVFSENSCEKFPTLVVWRGRAAFALQRVLEEANDRGVGHDWALMDASVRDLALWLASCGVLSQSDLQLVLLVLPKVAPNALSVQAVPTVQAVEPVQCDLSMETQSLLVCELASRLAYYNKIGPALDRLIVRASELAQFQFEVTGVEGIRRKYQTVSFAQLVCCTTFTTTSDNATTLTTTPTTTPTTATTSPTTTTTTTTPLGGSEVPRSITLLEVEPDTDILETPTLTEDGGDVRELSAAQQAVLISECSRVYYNSVEDDSLTLETVSALVNRALVLGGKQSADWLVYSASLYWRCRAEHLRTKTQGRSSYQLEALVKQYEEEQPDQRGKFVFSLNYPSIWEMQRELGERMMQVGMLLTAAEQFAKLEMWQLAVECMAMGGRRQQALDLLDTLRHGGVANSGEGLTPLLMCSLGDLTGDVTLYEEAWVKSGNSCARAQRTLGRRAIKAGEWQKATEHLEMALGVAPLFGEVWFSLGAAYMRLGDETRAARAFVRSLGVNEDDWQAWANLSAVYSREQRTMSQAKTAGMEAVKRNKNSYKLWENISIICMCLDDMQTVCTAERHLVLVMRREDRPDMVVLGRVFKEARSRRIKEPGFFRRVFELFKDMTDAGFIKADKQWQICAMCARLAVDQPELALELAFRAVRLASDCSQAEGVEDALELIDELVEVNKPQSVAALVMTVKALPRRLAALGIKDLVKVERLCASIKTKVEAGVAIPE